MIRRTCSRGNASSKKISTLREPLGIFHTTANSKDNTLEAHPNTERSMTIYQGMEKSFTSCCMFKDEEANSARPALIRF